MALSEWVKVERADELRAGMTVELRPCGFCGSRERLVLMRQVTTEHPVSLDSTAGDFVASGDAWSTAPGLCLHPRRPFDPSAAIVTGRLFRLTEPPVVADAETEERRLERVR